MSNRYLLGVDFGGGASKATLLRDDGAIIATASKEYETFYPQEGWTEQNPLDSYAAFVSNVKAILKNSSVEPKDIKAVCLDAATHTAVLLDENDNIVRNCIYWTDKRSYKESEYLYKNHLDDILGECYNAPSTFWTLPQLMWIKDNEPVNFSRISKIMFVKDYVRYQLTKNFVTDSIDAAGSMLMNVDSGKWSEKFCKLAGITSEQLPKIVAPSEIVGTVCEKAAKETGLAAETMVLAGTSDTVMEVYAAGAVKKSHSTIKLATAGRICFISEKAVPDPMLVNYRHVVPGMWYPGAATKSCAASYRWYRDVFGDYEKENEKENGDSYVQLAKAAADIQAGSNHLYFHPYLNGEITPYLDNDLKGSFTGVSSYHTKAHFTRAVLEGVAYSLLDSMKYINTLGVDIKQASIIGGGAKNELWRQILSDMLGIRLTKLKDCDSSLGSAMLAGVATGVFTSFEDSVEKCIKVETFIEPDETNHRKYKEGFKIYKKIHDALAPVYKHMR